MTYLYLANLERPVEVAVVSGLSPSYQLTGRYRMHTVRSATIFQQLKFDRLPFPQADVQARRKPLK